MRPISDLVQDITIAVRTLARRPGTAIVPVLSSSLAISACSLIVGIANVALFRPLPVADSSRLMSIDAQNLKTGDVGSAMSYPDYLDLTTVRSFENAAAYFPMTPAALSFDGTEPRRCWGTIATANYFDVVRPGFALGRGFDRARDDTPGAPPVIILSHHLWLSRFGGDPALIGGTIMVNGRSVTLLGVTEPGFRGTDVGMVSEFWIPLSMRDLVIPMLPANRLDPFADRDAKWLFTLGRLATGATREQADAELRVAGERLAAAYPATNRDRGFRVERAGQLVPPVRRAMLVFFILLLTVCGLVLLTACANIANLLLARATARHKEMATRRAIGAGSARLVRQLLTESMLLSLMGGALGYIIAGIGARSFGRMQLPMALPVDFSVSLDYRVLAVCTALSLLTGIVFGLTPALHAVRQNLVSGLKDQPVRLGRSRGWNVRNILMISQVAICIVLLVCSGLFLRTLNSARTADTGMAHRNLVLIGFDPFLQGNGSDRGDHLNALLRQVRSVPGVESAAISTTVPLSLAGVSGRVHGDGRLDQADRGLDSDLYDISPGFFGTVGIPFIAGEDFQPADANGEVAILNQAAAERLFHGANPIGRRVQVNDRRMLRVVGIVATAKSRMMVEALRPSVYTPLAGGAASHSITGVTLLVRTRGNPAAFVSPVSNAMHEVDRGLPLFDIRTMEQQIDNALLLQRAGAFLFGLAGLIGLVIAGAGLYGLVSFLVARQSREIGIRMALGARRGQILAGVLGKGLRMTAAGSAVGLPLAALLSRGIGSLLYGVSPTDGLTFASVTLFLLLTALAACILPALKAANIAPAISIRVE